MIMKLFKLSQEVDCFFLCFEGTLMFRIEYIQVWCAFSHTGFFFNIFQFTFLTLLITISSVDNA